MRKVVGVFNTVEQARRAVEDLKAGGYAPENISLVAKDSSKVEYLAETTDAVADNTAAGAVTGGLIGGLGGLLLGLGALAIPGLGPIVAAGPLAATLTGAAAGGLTGGLVGALTGIGVTEDEAIAYERNFNDGNVLVLVDSDEAHDKLVYDTFTRNETLNREYYPDQYKII